MTDTVPFVPSDASAVEKWSNRALQDSVNNRELMGMLISKGVLRRQNELQSGAGSHVNIAFARRIRAKAQVGMEAAEANALDAEYDNATCYLDEIHISLRYPNEGTIGRQHTDLDIPEDQYLRGVRYMKERTAVSVLNQLAGNNATSISWDSLTYNGGERGQIWGFNTPTAPSSTRVYRPNSLSTDQAVNADSTATATLSDVRTMESMAEKTRSYIQPLDMEGGVKFLYLVHTDVFDQLLEDTTSPYQMRDIHLARIAAGTLKTGVFGREFDFSQTRVMSLDKLPYGVHSATSAAQTNTRRSVFLGMDAGVVVFGKGHSESGRTTEGFRIREGNGDINRWHYINMGLIWGCAKLAYDGVDHGLITATHYVA